MLSKRFCVLSAPRQRGTSWSWKAISDSGTIVSLRSPVPQPRLVVRGFAHVSRFNLSHPDGQMPVLALSTESIINVKGIRFVVDNAAVERFMRPPVISIAVARATVIGARVFVTGVVCEIGLTHTGTDNRGVKWVRKDITITDPASTATIGVKLWGDEWAAFNALNRSVILYACHVSTYKDSLEMNSTDETTPEIIDAAVIVNRVTSILSYDDELTERDDVLIVMHDSSLYVERIVWETFCRGEDREMPLKVQLHLLDGRVTATEDDPIGEVEVQDEALAAVVMDV